MRDLDPLKILNSQSGVTLLELVVAIAVLGVLLGIAVPGFNNLLLNNRQVSATNEFIAALQSARSTAVTRNSLVTVCASQDQASCSGSDWSAGWITFADDNGNQNLDGGETLLRARGKLERINISSPDFGSALTFAANGRVTLPVVAGNGQFMVCDSRGAAHGKAIILSPSGRPRTSSTQDDGSAPAC